MSAQFKWNLKLKLEDVDLLKYLKYLSFYIKNIV